MSGENLPISWGGSSWWMCLFLVFWRLFGWFLLVVFGDNFQRDRNMSKSSNRLGKFRAYKLCKPRKPKKQQCVCPLWDMTLPLAYQPDISSKGQTSSSGVFQDAANIFRARLVGEKSPIKGTFCFPGGRSSESQQNSPETEA